MLDNIKNRLTDHNKIEGKFHCSGCRKRPKKIIRQKISKKSLDAVEILLISEKKKGCI